MERVRAHYQASKPTMEEALRESGQGEFLPLGAVLLLRRLTADLRQERERQQLTLAQLAEKTGMDEAVLSRVLNMKAENPTIETLCRIAAALGKAIDCKLVDAIAGAEAVGA